MRSKFLSILLILVTTGCANMKLPFGHSFSTQQSSTAVSNSDGELAAYISGKTVYGDMIVGPSSTVAVNAVSKGAAHINAAAAGAGNKVYLWPNAVIPVQFDSNVPAEGQKAFWKACTTWYYNSGVRCGARTSENPYLMVHQVSGLPGTNNLQGGYTDLGAPQRFGTQNMYISVQAWNQFVILHELGHILGLIHEHQRPDRDSFVRINFQNVLSSEKDQFDIMNAGTRGPFDFDSVMEYYSTAFSTNGNTTIESLDPNHPSSSIGNKSALTAQDGLVVQQMYGTTPPPAPSIVGISISYSQLLAMWALDNYQQVGQLESFWRSHFTQIVGQDVPGYEYFLATNEISANSVFTLSSWLANLTQIGVVTFNDDLIPSYQNQIQSLDSQAKSLMLRAQQSSDQNNYQAGVSSLSMAEAQANYTSCGYGYETIHILLTLYQETKCFNTAVSTFNSATQSFNLALQAPVILTCNALTLNQIVSSVFGVKAGDPTSWDIASNAGTTDDLAITLNDQNGPISDYYSNMSRADFYARLNGPFPMDSQGTYYRSATVKDKTTNQSCTTPRITIVVQPADPKILHCLSFTVNGQDGSNGPVSIRVGADSTWLVSTDANASDNLSLTLNDSNGPISSYYSNMSLADFSARLDGPLPAGSQGTYFRNVTVLDKTTGQSCTTNSLNVVVQ